MKLCIELDEKMQERWLSIKSSLEVGIECERDISVTLPDDVVLKGLLDGFENDTCSLSFPYKLTMKELKAMKKQKQCHIRIP